MNNQFLAVNENGVSFVIKTSDLKEAYQYIVNNLDLSQQWSLNRVNEVAKI